LSYGCVNKCKIQNAKVKIILTKFRK